MNKVQEALLKSLGLELDQEFEAEGNIYKFIFNGWMYLIKKANDVWIYDDDILSILINRPEKVRPIKKPILDEVEKKYLEAVLRPFKNIIKYITLNRTLRPTFGYIEVEMIPKGSIEYDSMNFPNFEIGTMYKGMEVNKKYTLKELGLFEE